MEDAQRGLFCSRGIPADIREALCRLDLPDWFPGWLEQVKYHFPKGHCAAFLLVDALQA